MIHYIRICPATFFFLSSISDLESYQRISSSSSILEVEEVQNVMVQIPQVVYSIEQQNYPCLDLNQMVKEQALQVHLIS